jgi:hypothetical protein
MGGWRTPNDEMLEPEIIAPGHVDWRSAWAAKPDLSQHLRTRPGIGRLWPLLILLLAPGIAFLSVLIISGLLGFFVAWLAALGFLFTATLVSDLVRAFRRSAYPPVGAVNQQVMG